MLHQPLYVYGSAQFRVAGMAHHMLMCRTTSVSNMMYVKEDLILPHSVSFYDLIVNKARGKSGPLFNFDVHEDIRLQNDASVEKEEAHAGGVSVPESV